ncbi:MAG: SH3 domain-containing protein [Candidatus Limiplasma sp.]|nr:SH3 domain-containing protein [Candidatus Limiplasma sp.]
MITVQQIVSAFREIIGWPYASPGSNGPRGIDCSGAFVFAYQKYKHTIYHGSNRIARVYCHDVRRVSGTAQLTPGMAIFKTRAAGENLKPEYKPGGKYYNPSLPEDFYHIGLVASVNPLQIINATPPVARVDTKLSAWSHAGYLKAVLYEEEPVPGPDPEPDPDPGPDPAPQVAVTTAPSGSTVNLRRSATKESVVLRRVPLGQQVTVLGDVDGVWWRVRYEGVTGYMMREFLRIV